MLVICHILQETLVNLAALVTSLFLTPLISGRPTLTWFLFFLFSFLHIYANYKAVSSVVMEVFNRIRFFSVANSFLSTRKYAFTPLQANRTESIFFRKLPMYCGKSFFLKMH